MIHTLSVDNPLLLLGCGNMGRAMLDGWLRSGIDPACFVVVDPHAQNLPDGVAHHKDYSSVDQCFRWALLAIKPQIFGEAAADILDLLSSDATVLSLLAGTRVDTLQEKLPGRSIIRIMPNLAASIGKSPIGIFSADSQAGGPIETLLRPLGTLCWLKDEALMDAVTALAGSGPAFVYRFIDALAAAGEDVGLDAEMALQLAKTMVNGASELAATQDSHPSELARRVTSPGGTTAAGLAVLDKDDALQNLLKATLTAARDHGVELSKPQ
jgi:pyrroline-5-carboxylate reductase